MKPLLLLICSIVVILVAVQHAQVACTFSVANPQGDWYLTGCHEIETNEHGTYRWSGPQSAFVLDGFWSRPALLRLRMASPCPANAPTAELKLKSGPWESGQFTVQDTWRSYTVLMPIARNGRQAVELKTPFFSPSEEDDRRLGVALSHIHATLPSVLPVRFSLNPAMVSALFLPLLMYEVVRRLLTVLFPKAKRTLVVGGSLLCFAGVLLLVAWSSFFPLQGGIGLHCYGLSLPYCLGYRWG